MKRKGFTLLEVVLALAIVGIISIFLLQIVSGSINITEGVSENKKTELTTNGGLEEQILKGTVEDGIEGIETYPIPIPGTGSVNLKSVEKTDDTGHVFRIYIPR